MSNYSDPVQSPPSPFHPTSFRKLRRRIRGTNRRHLLVLLLFSLVLLIIWQSTHRLAIYPYWNPSDLFTCASNRSSAHSISIPQPTNHDALSDTWKSLRTIFDAHPPHPAELPKPTHPSDQDFPTKEQLKSFLNITESEAHATRVEHAAVVRHIPPYPEDLFSGRGVITLAGGKYSEYAAVALGMLREVGSTLPVEVWMKDQTEEKEGWCAELEKEGMVCRRLSDYVDLSSLPVPYQWKVFVMLFSSFEEFIFLDADSMPVKNPDPVFESKAYRDTGAILWPDYWKHTGTPWLPFVMGISDEASDMLQDEKSVESGQIVWNKHIHWKSLCLATFYSYFGPSYYYSLINQGWAGWGDKDTFPMALKAFREPYYQVHHDIMTLFVNGTLLGIGMVQSDPADDTHTEPLFLHSNIIKWSVADFLCVGCPANIFSAGSVSALENPQSPINMHLKDGKRIFATQQLAEAGLDPEPLIWRCMEHTACRSVWGNKQLCGQTRDYMEKTFGYHFRSTRTAFLIGYGDRLCAVDP